MKGKLQQICSLVILNYSNKSESKVLTKFVVGKWPMKTEWEGTSHYVVQISQGQGC